MIIELKKFGEVLTSRDSGKEAFNVVQVLLKDLEENEELILDFDGVYSFSPSWGDEFLINLRKKYKNRLILRNTENPSVVATLELLREINNITFNLV